MSQLNCFTCIAGTDTNQRAQICVNVPWEKKKSLFNNHILPTNSFASFSHILQGKEPQCMAWKGAAACQLYWLLGTSLCFMCSPTYCFSLCMGLGVKEHLGANEQL